MKFPDPKAVDDVGVTAVIEQFCRKREDLHNIRPGYEFEHIVLGDYNLDDSYIDFCIGESGDKWLQDALRDAPQNAIDSTAPLEETWKRWAYDEIVQYRKDVLELFAWLKSVPEERRE